ncbi:hypothetical protein J5Y03_17820 [Bacillus sp. RG28]|uniref:Phr family secreted Rap phosphatase inhibitor n=1 Tax=Gottfriedia endophytica TaxID=2820819 RepID=A0A940NSI0_9BACI|nr:hypothetical protein [Gottfriedia endophytica]MBP0727020.1 hypothetical protein [Gottfriedia endophytica]
MKKILLITGVLVVLASVSFNLVNKESDLTSSQSMTASSSQPITPYNKIFPGA